MPPLIANTHTLLDIGGGIGVICHELLGQGLVSATLVEAASAYLDGARAEAEVKGRVDRLRLVHGDFVEVATAMMPAELVRTLGLRAPEGPDREVHYVSLPQRRIQDGGAPGQLVSTGQQARDQERALLLVEPEDGPRQRWE